MDTTSNIHEEDDSGDVFLNEEDIVQEINVDDEDLPDADEDEEGGFDGAGGGFGVDDEDDSMHTFTGHTGELYAVVCSPIDPTLVATGGGDDKGFLWKIGQGDWAFELLGKL